MTTRELRLRQRIDVITDERKRCAKCGQFMGRTHACGALVASLVAQRDRARAQLARQRHGYTAWCVYCGVKVKSHGHPATCRAHRDLVELDVFYAELLEEAA